MTTPPDPSAIRRLDAAVVNRIAAGEIIARPANALKEMLENSLDARSTSIQITVKEGGLKFLQIQDNGTGIRPEDLPIVCERHTTSKLHAFDDLAAITTYGFRGEALASISHVAHLTIQTKTRSAACAFRCAYADGVPTAAAPKRVAGNQGTQITVEDLFYNVPQRRRALRSPADELARITDVVSRYAVHNASVAFALRRQGGASAEPIVRTVANSSQRQNISVIYGADVARDLVPIELDDAVLRVRARGFVTNVNYASKRCTMLLFINHRLVESAALRASIDEVYGTYLPKGSHPFVYLSLEIAPGNVDVNVHPTKHEVHFLHEDEILERLRACVERTLLGHNEARRFYTQTLLPGASQVADGGAARAAAADADATTAAASQSNTVQDKNIVRTDSREQKLEKFFGNATLMSTTTLLTQSMTATALDSDDDEDDGHVLDQSLHKSSASRPPPSQVPAIAAKFRPNVLRKQTKLTSILRMRQRCEDNCDPALRRLLGELTFVGVVDRRRALVQHDTKLYLCDTRRLSAAVFEQILLYDFENFGRLRLSGDGLAIRELAAIALRSPASGWTEADGTVEELAATVHDLFVEKAAILREYYGFVVCAAGRLRQLPVLLANHRPSMAHLPMYVLRLATEVHWDEERPFFESFGRETGAYYAIIPNESEVIDAAVSGQQQSADASVGVEKAEPLSWRWHVEHVLYAALKEHFLPQRELGQDGTFLQVAQLANLYKVFERC